MPHARLYDPKSGRNYNEISGEFERPISAHCSCMRRGAQCPPSRDSQATRIHSMCFGQKDYFETQAGSARDHGAGYADCRIMGSDRLCRHD